MYIVQITGKYINILVFAGGEFKMANTNKFSLARLTREFLFALVFFCLYLFLCLYLYIYRRPLRGCIKTVCFFFLLVKKKTETTPSPFFDHLSFFSDKDFWIGQDPPPPPMKKICQKWSKIGQNWSKIGQNWS